MTNVDNLPIICAFKPGMNTQKISCSDITTKKYDYVSVQDFQKFIEEFMSDIIHINDEVYKSFRDLKVDMKYRYCIYKFNDDLTALEVEKLGNRSDTFDQFKKEVPKDKPRYLVYSEEFTNSYGK